MLKTKQIEHAKEGMHPDGNGLYLRVQPSGAKSWIFRFQLNGRRREMGLGTLLDKTAVQARAEAAQCSLQVRAGIDPIEARRSLTNNQINFISGGDQFKTVAAAYIEAHKDGWSNAKHAAQWTSTLKAYAYPVIGQKSVAEIDTDDILRILSPIWSDKTETASRVRSRIELILSYAKARKMRQGENPAVWRGHLDALLPKPAKVKVVRHHPALPYKLLPDFMADLRQMPGTGARALEFAILTAARSGEVRGATLSEFDLPNAVWNIPGSRMKAKRDHRVPLSNAALSILAGLTRSERTELIFLGERTKRTIGSTLPPVSDMTLSAVIKRMNATRIDKWIDPKNRDEVVPHGFRSTFRDWAAEATTYSNEMVEMALAHTVGNKVEAAYRRGDMFERRRELMETWANFCMDSRNLV